MLLGLQAYSRISAQIPADFLQYEDLVKPTDVFVNTVIGSGARAFGVGGAFIAIADDATATTWNPAGLARMIDPEMSFVFTDYSYNVKVPPLFAFTNNYSEQKLEGKGTNIDFISFAFPIEVSKRELRIVPQMSYQRILNYKSNEHLLEPVSLLMGLPPLQYFKGSINSFRKEYSGGFNNISLSVGIPFSASMQIGATLNYWYGGHTGTEKSQLEGTLIRNFPWFSPKGMSFRSDTTHFSADILQQSTARIHGINGNFGLMICMSENFRIGLVYKLPCILNYESEFLFSNKNVIIDSTSYEQSGNLHYPGILGLGVSFRPASQWTITTDYTVCEWSKCQLEMLRRTCRNGADSLIDQENFPGNDYISASRKQSNTQQYRLGTEYVLLRSKYSFPLRLGFFIYTPYIKDGRDRTPLYYGYTAGVGIGCMNNLFIDAAVVYQTGSSFISDNKERKMEYTQVYLSMNYKMDFFNK